MFGTVLLWKEEKAPGLDLAARNRIPQINSGLNKVGCISFPGVSLEGGGGGLSQSPRGWQGHRHHLSHWLPLLRLPQGPTWMLEL